MFPTPYPHINAILAYLLSEMQQILGDKLVGLYLYGSLVTGDFDPRSSDIDLLAATATEIDEQDVDALKRMHDHVAAQHQEWEDRIEVQYFSVAGLRTFKSQASAMAVISPGEPLHLIEAGALWTMNWYVVQEHGITLFGPSPRTLIKPISRAEFVQSIREHMQRWDEWLAHLARGKPSQAYAILTMCRGLYTHAFGEQVSKKQAAIWAQGQLPEWAPLIADALIWRATWREAQGDPEETFPETARFVRYVAALIAEGT